MKVVRFLLVVAALLLSVIWSQSTIGRMLFLGQKPDLPIVVLVLISLRVRPGFAGMAGFFSGVLQGGSAGANLTAYGITRTLLSFACANIPRTGIALNPASTAGIATLATLGAQFLLLFMAPPPDIGGFIGATLGTAIYNGVLAGLFDLILRRTLEKQVD